MMKSERKKDIADSAAGLGERLRMRRKEQGMTLQAVARASSLTTGFISQVERDIAAPSLSSLTSIAEALGAHISDFLQPPRNANEMTRADLREMYTLPGAVISYERLSTNFPGSQLTTVVVHHPPNHETEPMRHRGEELYFILEGEVTVYVDDENTVLRSGDSIHFESTRLHHVRNHTDQPAKMLVCNTMDVFGDDP